MRKSIKTLVLLLGTVLVLTGCADRGGDDVTAEAVQDRIREALQTHRIERILAVADSLEEAGVMTAPRADLLRGRGYDRCWQMRLAEHYYKKAFEAFSADPAQDWQHYAESGYRWAYLRYARCDTEGALDIVSRLMAKAEDNKAFPSGNKSALLMLMAECQMQLHHPDEARRSYLLAYEAQKEAVKQGDSVSCFNMAVVCFNNSRNFFDSGDYDEASTWLQRCEETLQTYAQHGDSGIIEEWKGHVALQNARILHASGREKEAASVFAAIPRSRIFNPTTISAAIEYLTAAGRYSEAVHYYDRLDSTYVATDGAQLNLDNITTRLAPRYIATMKAGRTDDALAIGADICNALDSALVWQKKNDAAELAVIYQTHEKDLQYKDLQFTVYWHRFMAVALVAILLLIGYLLWRAHKYNKVLAAKNRHLYEQIEQREKAETEERQKLQAQPEESLTNEQQLFRRLCTLMTEQQPYTDENLNREALAQMLGSNAKYVAQAIHDCSHEETTNDFITRYRLEYVAHLLKATDHPISVIGEMAGIPSRATLARLFRNTYGMTCSEFRQMANSEQ